MGVWEWGSHQGVSKNSTNLKVQSSNPPAYPSFLSSAGLEQSGAVLFGY